jgi:pimeloyl-ACP methyl ester carboxylesterase
MTVGSCTVEGAEKDPIPIMTTAMQNWLDIYFTSHDGLRLHARHYPAPGSRRRTVLCLPGLTRNSRDFHPLASFLSDPRNPHARAVVAVDYRGRGHSQWDENWRNYALHTELQDALDLVTILGLHDLAVVGTSRGGLIAMMMACLRPASMGAVVLNDIGPVVERDGLVRMVASVGRMPLPPTWEEATALIRDMSVRSFPAIPEEHWPEIARQWLNDDRGRTSRGYDPNLSKALSLIDGPMPELWAQFKALSRLPAMAIRGEVSDVMSEATLSGMRLAHPDLTAVTVRGQGHAPLLRDRSTLVAIADFLGRADPVDHRAADRWHPAA